MTTTNPTLEPADSVVTAAAIRLGDRVKELSHAHPTVRSAFLQACIEHDHHETDDAPALLSGAMQWVADEGGAATEEAALVVGTDNLRHRLVVELTEEQNR